MRTSENRLQEERIEWIGNEMKGMREEISSLLRRSTLRSTVDETDHDTRATHYNLGKYLNKNHKVRSLCQALVSSSNKLEVTLKYIYLRSRSFRLREQRNTRQDIN